MQRITTAFHLIVTGYSGEVSLNYYMVNDHHHKP